MHNGLLAYVMMLIVVPTTAKQLQLVPGRPVCCWLRPHQASWVA